MRGHLGVTRSSDNRRRNVLAMSASDALLWFVILFSVGAFTWAMVNHRR
jgi:hypothetical protein